MRGFRTIRILRMFQASHITDILRHLTTKSHRQCLNTATDSQHRYLTVVSQTSRHQLRQIPLLIDPMKLRRRLFSNPQRIDITATAQDQSVNTLQCVNDRICVGHRRNHHRYTPSRHDRLVIAFSQLTGQILIITRDAYYRPVFRLGIPRIDTIQMRLQVKLFHSYFRSSSIQIGISRFRLCSKEIRVSVATTPWMLWSLPFSRSISCSLSRAYSFTSMV